TCAGGSGSLAGRGRGHRPPAKVCCTPSRRGSSHRLPGSFTGITPGRTMILADLTGQLPSPLLAMHPAVYGIGLLAVAIVAFAVAWVVFRRPLERRRIYGLAQRLLHEGQWETALMT